MPSISNSKKHLAPVCIITILKSYGSLTQEEIHEKLLNCHGIEINSRTLQRHLNTITAEELYVFRDGEKYVYDERGYRNGRHLKHLETFEGNRNDRKSLLCCFLMNLLENKSNYRKPISILHLERTLKEFPYDLKVDRRALGRELSALHMEFPEVKWCSEGYYIDLTGHLFAA